MRADNTFLQRWKQQKYAPSNRVSEPTASYGSQENHLPHDMLQLRQKLWAQFHNIPLEKVFPGKEVHGALGSCYCIQQSVPIEVPSREIQRTKNRLQASLQLIPGLGPTTERQLHHETIFTFSQIPTSSRFYPIANQYIQQIEKGPYTDLYWSFHQVYGKDHPDLLQLSRLIPTDRLVFMDIETMGLGSQPITLIGIGRILQNTLHIIQYFARTIEEESSILVNLSASMHKDDFFVTFNGEYFDIPYIKNRSRYHRLEHTAYPPNFDALFFARKVWKQDLPNCKLQTIEKEIFHINRFDDVPGAFCPAFYQTYLQSRQIGTIVPIIKHNQQDIITLAKIFFRLQQIWR